LTVIRGDFVICSGEVLGEPRDMGRSRCSPSFSSFRCLITPPLPQSLRKVSQSCVWTQTFPQCETLWKWVFAGPIHYVATPPSFPTDIDRNCFLPSPGFEPRTCTSVCSALAQFCCARKWWWWWWWWWLPFLPADFSLFLFPGTSSRCS